MFACHAAMPPRAVFAASAPARHNARHATRARSARAALCCRCRLCRVVRYAMVLRANTAAKRRRARDARMSASAPRCCARHAATHAALCSAYRCHVYEEASRRCRTARCCHALRRYASISEMFARRRTRGTRCALYASARVHMQPMRWRIRAKTAARRAPRVTQRRHALRRGD